MIALGCDHGGYKLKTVIMEYLDKTGVEYKDYGCYSEESVDYPVYVAKVAYAVKEGTAQQGILCCTTGIGVSMAANKVKGIRAAVCTNDYVAEMTRRHNNANVLCLGGAVVTQEEAISIVKKFLYTDFEGGKHSRRVDMIKEIEDGTLK